MYGDSKESYLIALIVPNQPYLTQLSNELGISGSFEELCGNSQIIEKVAKDIQVVSKESELIAVFVYFVFVFFSLANVHGTVRSFDKLQ